MIRLGLLKHALFPFHVTPDRNGYVMKRHFASTAIATIGLIVSGLASAPASMATVDWVPAPTLKAVATTATNNTCTAALAAADSCAYDWMSALNSVEGDGVFQQDRREFNLAQAKLTASESQHQITWVRTDTRTVSVRYDCTKQQGDDIAVPNDAAMNARRADCASKNVQFEIDSSGVPEDRVITTANGTTLTGASDSIYHVTATTNAYGKAEVTFTVTDVNSDPAAGDDPESTTDTGLREDDGIAIKAMNYDKGTSQTACTEATCSNQIVLMWQNAGYFPQVHMLNQDNSPAYNKCGGLKWAMDETWYWSVFKKSWLGEYACVYSKSYLAGSTITIPYHVTDIWGQPIVGAPVDFIHPPQYCNGGGTVACTWTNMDDHKYTDSNGYVSFSLQNTNTPDQVCANVGLNGEDELLPKIQQRRTNCGMGADFYATLNQSPESFDLFWPQIVNSMTIPASSFSFKITKRGVLNVTPNTTLTPGIVVANGGDPIPIDIAGTTTNDNVVVTVTKPLAEAGKRFEYFTNDNPDAGCFVPVRKSNGAIKSWKKTSRTCKMKQSLYAPDVTISATNGGYAVRVCNDGLNVDVCHNQYNLPLAGEVKDVSQMNAVETFSLQYASSFVLMGTREGTTTFTISVGNQSYQVSQTYSKRGITTVRNIEAPESSVVGAVGQTRNVTFKVADRYGNGFAGVPVTVTQTGGSFAADQTGVTDLGSGSSKVDLISDADGNVTVKAAAPGAGSTNGTQTLTAVASNPDGVTTQLGDAALTNPTVPASVTSVQTVVRWGDIVRLTNPTLSGTAKTNKYVTVVPGTWQAFPAVTYTYTWYACTTKALVASTTIPETCTRIVAASGSPLKLIKATMTTPYNKKYLRVLETVHSAGGPDQSVLSASLAKAIAK